MVVGHCIVFHESSYLTQKVFNLSHINTQDDLFSLRCHMHRVASTECTYFHYINGNSEF